MFEDVQKNGRLLNQVIVTERETLAILLNPCQDTRVMGRNLDYCIETHIHGDVSLTDDVEYFYVDESFAESALSEKIELLCEKYGIILRWITKRQLKVKDLGDLFRGPNIPILAQKIDSRIGNNQGVINAALIGEASCNSLYNPGLWHDIGNEAEIFQYFKQLWHTVAFFG